MRTENSLKTVQWVRDIKSGFKNSQRPDLHFYDLSQIQKLSVCKQLADLPLRCFVTISNKKNMRGYKNDRAEQVRSNNPFYNWMLRLLLERVTNYCARRTFKDYNEVRKLRIELAATGGFSIPQMQAYMSYIKNQSANNTLFLTKGDIDWRFIDIEEIKSFQAGRRAGLQLADVVASAFRQAVDTKSDCTKPQECALALLPRFARDTKSRIADYGVKAMPSPLWIADLTNPQIDFFSQIGYSKRYLVSLVPRLANRF